MLPDGKDYSEMSENSELGIDITHSDAIELENMDINSISDKSEQIDDERMDASTTSTKHKQHEEVRNKYPRSYIQNAIVIYVDGLLISNFVKFVEEIKQKYLPRIVFFVPFKEKGEVHVGFSCKDDVYEAISIEIFYKDTVLKTNQLYLSHEILCEMHFTGLPFDGQVAIFEGKIANYLKNYGKVLKCSLLKYTNSELYKPELEALVSLHLNQNLNKKVPKLINILGVLVPVMVKFYSENDDFVVNKSEIPEPEKIVKGEENAAQELNRNKSVAAAKESICLIEAQPPDTANDNDDKDAAERYDALDVNNVDQQINDSDWEESPQPLPVADESVQLSQGLSDPQKLNQSFSEPPKLNQNLDEPQNSNQDLNELPKLDQNSTEVLKVDPVSEDRESLIDSWAQFSTEPTKPVKPIQSFSKRPFRPRTDREFPPRQGFNRPNNNKGYPGPRINHQYTQSNSFGSNPIPAPTYPSNSNGSGYNGRSNYYRNNNFNSYEGGYNRKAPRTSYNDKPNRSNNVNYQLNSAKIKSDSDVGFQTIYPTNPNQNFNQNLGYYSNQQTNPNEITHYDHKSGYYNGFSRASFDSNNMNYGNHNGNFNFGNNNQGYQ